VPFPKDPRPPLPQHQGQTWFLAPTLPVLKKSVSICFGKWGF
jgi:hypothetical protein